MAAGGQQEQNLAKLRQVRMHSLLAAGHRAGLAPRHLEAEWAHASPEQRGKLFSSAMAQVTSRKYNGCLLRHIKQRSRDV